LFESLLSVRPYLEIAYYAAGVLLLFGIIITFFQLILIKSDIRLRNERAAKERAIEAADRYFSSFVGFMNSTLLGTDFVADFNEQRTSSGASP
jgi:hypothetical protein